MPAFSYGAALLFLALWPAACAYMHEAWLRGQVVDVSGQALPGVVVSASGTESEALTNALGEYSLGAFTGRMQLEFFKTGYTPARLEITIDAMGVTEAPQVALWPLPIGEGVYLFQDYHYRQTNHPRPNQYEVEELGTAFGTPVNPELVIPWTDPALAPDKNPPLMIGHKVPAYDARMYKMRRANAAPIHPGTGEAAVENDEKTQYLETIWVAENSVAIRSTALDEPARLLVELRAVSPLQPGVYAIHWGALDGYDSIEPRIFLFALEARPEETEEGEVEGEEGETPPE